ncbi:hypothetical protein BOTBODRAFT_38254 [Botryobasidium botryosum FD-172 SS1]|uniref:tRNA-splicing endonuclease subunit Sen54 N-terminal domain-containing protein n=1 Tax=Botryobasidium botryosum (strain FD-172 SS1) TaxID=930990 RepID=A0A067LXB8_BOTB1|nr:hypothetical protein BOTBODRAFT_38254 [Botryobasidium botryosum FD-172 SS1]
MEDEYESPKFISPSTENAAGEVGEADSSGDEDTPDWTKFAATASDVSRPVLPKRGEKDFEPAAGGGSGLQSYTLDRSRSAMVNALKAGRGINSKSVSYGIWIPALSRVHVVQARGVHFANIGHSARRGAPNPSPVVADGKLAKLPPSRLELLPEEALYMIERGSMFCWKREGGEGEVDGPCEVGDPNVQGTPMSVQQGFAEMIGKEALTLERYQVYSYLKRLGYLCTRTEAPASSPFYPIPAPRKGSELVTPPSVSIFRRLALWITVPLGRLFNTFSSALRPRIDCWAPLGVRGVVRTYSDIFKSLRIIPAGHAVPLYIKEKAPTDTHYKVFYNVWKPSTPWKKTALPPPDFEVVVINARTTSLPSLLEITALFSTLPVTPVPASRRRQPQQQKPSQPAPEPAPASALTTTVMSRVLAFLNIKSAPQVKTDAPRPPNAFGALKAGNKMVVLAVVDGGAISFLRIGQGCFEEWPMA